MIIVTVDFHPTKEHKDNFLTAFNNLAKESRKEDGCISYDIYPKDENALGFLLLEKWESKAKLDIHAATTHFAEFMNTTKEWFEKEMEIHIYEANKIQ